MLQLTAVHPSLSVIGLQATHPVALLQSLSPGQTARYTYIGSVTIGHLNFAPAQGYFIEFGFGPIYIVACVTNLLQQPLVPPGQRQDLKSSTLEHPFLMPGFTGIRYSIQIEVSHLPALTKETPVEVIRQCKANMNIIEFWMRIGFEG